MIILIAGTTHTGKTAYAQKLLEKYPEAEIYCVDSLISSLGQGSLAIMASNLRAEGKSAKETAQHIEDVRLNVNQAGTAETLEYMRKAGRVTASKAFFGNLFGVKPIIISDIKGQNFAYKKAKGMSNALKAIAEDIKDAADGNYDALYITHADCIELAEALRDAILAVAPFKNVQIGIIGPIVGATVGPGTIIAFCYGKTVTIEGNE
jgi:DegV family protein with EDD domain